MKTYTASNGIEVSSETQPFTGDRRLRFCGPQESDTIEISSRNMRALIETLDAERDEELGRWRWPENPDYVVYPDEDGDVIVLNERKAISSLVIRRDLPQLNTDLDRTKAARAYFEAHPERKPWEDAKEGEVWIVTPSKALTLGEKAEYPAIFQAGMFRDHGGSWDAAGLTAARRIWPEEA